MKTIAFCLFLCCFCCTLVCAQFATSKYAESRSTYQFARQSFDPHSPTAPLAFKAAHDTGDLLVGVAAGLILSKLAYNADNFNDGKFKAGPYFGARLYYWVTAQFVLQTGLLLALNGSAYDNDKLKMTSILLPILAGYMVTTELMVMAGIQLSFILSAKNDDGNDLKDYYKGVNLGLVIGLSYQLMENLVAEAMYEQGVSDLNDTSGIEDYSVEIRSRMFMIGLRYTLFNR